jgi:hypothetical protein
MGRAAVLVPRAAPLRDDPLPALAARALPRLRVVEGGHSRQRRFERQRLQQRVACLDWERRDVAPIEPEDVEHVVGHLARLPPHAGRLAVEDRVVDREALDGLDEGRVGRVLRQAVT